MIRYVRVKSDHDLIYFLLGTLVTSLTDLKFRILNQDNQRNREFPYITNMWKTLKLHLFHLEQETIYEKETYVDLRKIKYVYKHAEEETNEVVIFGYELKVLDNFDYIPIMSDTLPTIKPGSEGIVDFSNSLINIKPEDEDAIIEATDEYIDNVKSLFVDNEFLSLKLLINSL